ncbi:nitroreductase [Brevundimonas sp. 2R-24]|uniref:Putative NAD(P)H nitroreductase n=1 Tax=Peiella sedimenti TaxID=3061083 RepID=A0ABT8SK58_9CAUL|nr:nitroreductase [Caulobacteraceae bacterium XZ-24]
MSDLLPRTAFGQALPSPKASDACIRRLALRRSAPAQDLAPPGPSAEQLEAILTLGARTPDHGKLFPWRLVVLSPERKADLVQKLEPLAADQADPTRALAVLAKFRNPPCTVLVISSPTPGHKVPVWEQQLSAGAVCMNLLHAADAFGFSANWITDWYAYDPRTTRLFGVREGEQVAGFIHVGTAANPSLERPRPAVADLASEAS